MGMLSQILTLLITAVLGFLAIFIVELQTKKKNSSSKDLETEDSNTTKNSTGETHSVTAPNDALTIGEPQQKGV